MKLTFLGADREVTGSCHLLEAAGLRILIDCGMEQGTDVYENQELPVPASEQTVMQTLRILCAADQTLSQLREAIPSYYATEEIRVDCPDERKFEVMKGIAADVLRTHKAHTIDGVRIVYDGGWGLIRASNTQPVLAVRCEGRTPADRDAIAADISRRLKAAGLPDFEWKI